MVRLNLIIVCIFVLFTPVFSESVYDAVTIKHGFINTDEQWSGKIILTGDVVISKGVTVTVLPETWLIFQTKDHHPLGENPNKVEIIVLGHLIHQDPTIKMVSTQDPTVQSFLSQYAPTISTFKAQPVSTKGIESRWRSFKHQYAIVWAMMYSLAVIL